MNTIRLIITLAVMYGAYSCFSKKQEKSDAHNSLMCPDNRPLFPNGIGISKDVITDVVFLALLFDFAQKLFDSA